MLLDIRQVPGHSVAVRPLPPQLSPTGTTTSCCIGHELISSSHTTVAGVPRTATLAWFSWKLCSDTSVIRAAAWNSGRLVAPHETMVALILAIVTARPSSRSPAYGT